MGLVWGDVKFLVFSGEGVVVGTRGWWRRRVGVGGDSPRRAPPGAHKGSPLRVEGAHEGSPLRGGGRPRGIAPTEGGHEGSPLRGGGRPRGIAPTGGRAATRDRPYGGEGGHGYRLAT